MVIKTKQQGFTVIELLIVLVILGIVGATGFYIFSKKGGNSSSNTSGNQKASTAAQKPEETKIKSLGITLGYYDSSTNKAGDFLFTKAKFDAGPTLQMIFMNFGNIVPASSAGPEKANPQPTFILPLGTKVHALADGEVFNVPKLYSGDYSVIVKGEDGKYLFETEHVINPKVKKGDKVRAGDVVAEVSDYETKGYAGFGLFEIGVMPMQNDGEPHHVCPFLYLDESIKENTLKMITALEKSWEDYRGDSTIYNESIIKTPGCETLDPIEG